jgi:hypothetical protein
MFLFDFHFSKSILKNDVKIFFILHTIAYRQSQQGNRNHDPDQARARPPEIAIR